MPDNTAIPCALAAKGAELQRVGPPLRSMLISSDLRLSKAVLDFRSSGQARRSVTQLFSGETLLLNGLELADFQEPAFQAVTCEQCGHEGCEPGGWISLRRLADDVLWIPAWSELDCSDSSMGDLLDEMGPPAYLEHGYLLIESVAWSQLRAAHKAVPAAEDLPPLSCHELARTLQWGAPLSWLGRFPAPPEPNLSAVLTADGGVASEYVERIGSTLTKLYANRLPVLAEIPVDEVSLKRVILDGPGYPEWSFFAVAGCEHVSFHLGPYEVRSPGGVG